MSEPYAHFSFSNIMYDKCNLDKKNQESIGPFNWITDSVYENKESCYQFNSPFMHNQYNNIPSSSIDVSSDLRNQTRLLSKCPENKFDPTKLSNCKACENCNQGLPCGCSHCKDTKNNNKLNDCKFDGLVPQYTRLNKPCNIFSGININRFNPLFEDLQDSSKIQSNSYIGINSRLTVKDAFKNKQ